jgi:hypothetical protein
LHGSEIEDAGYNLRDAFITDIANSRNPLIWYFYRDIR